MADSAGEFDLIARFRARTPTNSRVPLGIGDDAALIATSGATLLAADMIMEDRHFTVAETSPELIGRKALAVNLSDLSAMAGRPTAAVVSVAHRRKYGPDFADQLLTGLQDLADEYGVAIAGGDTNVWDGPVVVNVTVLGEVTADRAVTRGGARPGDAIFATGPLGGSLRSGRHLSFTPRLAEARRLHEAVDLHAMIDISDGLLADLGHICEESGVGAELWSDAIPIHDDVPLRIEPQERLLAALTDGEDFELAFCIDTEDANRLRTTPPPEVRTHEVGRIVPEPGIRVFDNNQSPIDMPGAGWVHRW